MESSIKPYVKLQDESTRPFDDFRLWLTQKLAVGRAGRCAAQSVRMVVAAMTMTHSCQSGRGDNRRDLEGARVIIKDNE